MKPYNFIKPNNMLTVRKIVMVNYVDFLYHKAFESHNFWELIYVDKGILTLNIDDETFTLCAGELILYAPKSLHCEIEKRRNCKAIISFQATSDIMPLFHKKIFKVNLKEKTNLEHIISEGVECFDPLPADCPCVGQRVKAGIAEYRVQLIKNNIEMFLIELYQKAISEKTIDDKPVFSNSKNYKEELINHIIKYMTDNLDKNISLNQISNDTGISTSQMKKIFKDKFDCGIIDFFNNLKMEEAKRLITNTSMNFTQISERLGFSSIHYFSKTFKKRTNMTPSEFSKSVNK